MKFIFPRNYRYKPKILGFIDHITAIIDLIIGIILFLVLKIFVEKVLIRVYIFIILFFPVVLISIVLLSEENVFEYIVIIIRFIKRRGVYFYDKNNYMENK